MIATEILLPRVHLAECIGTEVCIDDVLKVAAKFETLLFLVGDTQMRGTAWHIRL